MALGEPLIMVAYGILVLPPTKRTKAAYFDVIQPWYPGNASAIVTFDNIWLYFNSLKKFVPGHGYYPKPPKIVLIFHQDNLAAGKRFGLRNIFKVCTGERYLGGFIKNKKSKRDWLKDRTSKWEKKIVRSLKWRENIPRRVILRWFV